MRRPIENNASPGQAIYEPFSGSGTTIIAAEMLSRELRLPDLYSTIAQSAAAKVFVYTPAAAGGLLEDLSERRPSDADEHDKLFQRHRWEVVGPDPL